MPTLAVIVNDFRALLHLPPLDKKYLDKIIKKYTPKNQKSGKKEKEQQETEEKEADVKKLPPIDPTVEPHKEIYERLTEYGLDIDTIVVENGNLWYKIDVPANRPDLLSVESIAYTLRAFRGEFRPQFRLTTPQLTLNYDESVATVRPYIICCVLRNIYFTEASYRSFIDFQDKLHQNLCRRRTLASIGTHDLDLCKPPFLYQAQPPKDIKFVPLMGGPEVDGTTLFENLSHHPQLSQYLYLLEGKETWPVVRDSEGVCSLPPIINSHRTKISLNTKNVFIECTAMDYTRAMNAVVVLAAAFATYGTPIEENGASVFQIEPVTIVRQGKETITPNFNAVDFKVKCDYIRMISGLKDLSRPDIKNLLTKMLLDVEDDGDDGLLVHAPATRSDILHPCDIAEDVCVAFGFNNIDQISRKDITSGSFLPINQFCDRLREELAAQLYYEECTFSLVSNSENFDKQCLPRTEAVKVKNAQTAKLEIVRTNLLGGLLKIARSVFNQPNIKRPVPLRIFEISDVVLIDPTTETGAKNHRRLCAMIADTKSQFTEIHGLLDRVAVLVGAKEGDMKLERDDCPTCIPGQRAKILFKGQNVGWIGVLHPQVLINFRLTTPIAAMEIEIAPFLKKN